MLEPDTLMSVVQASELAARAHGEQRDRDGSLHIDHVARVAGSVCTSDAHRRVAWLHDVVEDTETSPEEIRAEFGDDVARLVEGVTKLTRIQFQSREQAEAENYRKLIVAMAAERCEVRMYQRDPAGWDYPASVARKLSWDKDRFQIKTLPQDQGP